MGGEKNIPAKVRIFCAVLCITVRVAPTRKSGALLSAFVRGLTKCVWHKYMTNTFLIALSLSTILGCAALRPAPVEYIAKLPVVRVGDPPPKNTEYVLFYPVGLTFPVKLKTSGTLFASEKQVESQAILAKDLYLYKYWASHDGKTWKNSHELLGVEFGGGLDVTGLQANIKLEAK